jgi:hypothetical protein
MGDVNEKYAKAVEPGEWKVTSAPDTAAPDSAIAITVERK